ncbi:competence protein CoiA [Anaerobacillus sp. MEB173]|uniref:competence protein CoiA n=1 Tax=Anaerobacillus sp. MEB173 TaxID=3383345 RepID=UPI003F8D9F7D
MLVAKSDTGQYISLAAPWEKNDLFTMRKEQNFFCTTCNGEVQLRLGEKRIWHFAHRSAHSCDIEIEPESAYHLSGKIQLYHWAKKTNKNVQLEPYIKNIKQRPDILVETYSGKRIAIEYQCSTLSHATFSKRTNQYYRIGITPIWILGGNRIRRLSHSIVQLQSFDWLFAKNADRFHQLSILYFCPTSKQFIYLTDLIPYSSTKTLTSLKIYPQESFPFSYLTDFQKNIRVSKQNDWLIIKKHWRYSNTSFKKSYAHHYMNKVFQTLGTPLSLFPSEAGFPTPYHFVVETPSYLWQSWILIYFLHLQSNQPFHLKQLIISFETLVRKRVFTLRRLPQVKNNDLSLAIRGYLYFLCKLEIIGQINEETFIKRRKVICPQSIEQAYKGDQQLLSTYFKRKEI